MRSFRRILLYADPAANIEPAYSYAALVAGSNRGIVTVADCLPKKPTAADSGWELPRTRDARLREELEAADQRCTRLATICNRFQEKDVPAAAKILVGQPVREIVREVRKSGHDLVITTAQLDRGNRDSGGAVAARLMRSCPCPVWIVDPRQSDRCDRILATIDVSQDHPDLVKLNRNVLETAAQLAKTSGGKLHVLYAWRPDLVSMSGMRVSQEIVQRYLDESRHLEKKKLASLLRPCGESISSASVHFRRGDRLDVIPEFASRRRIDVIVMGTVGRTGISGILMGNTAEMVLPRVNCSVLTVNLRATGAPPSADQPAPRHRSAPTTAEQITLGDGPGIRTPRTLSATGEHPVERQRLLAGKGR